MPRLRKIIIAFLLVFPCLVMAAGAVNLNTASASALAAAIKGVGETKAQAIVAYRKEHGPFHSIDDLTQVPGIGDRIVEMNRDHMTTDSPSKH